MLYHFQESEEKNHAILFFVENHWNELLRFSRRSQHQMEQWAARYGRKDDPKAVLDHAKGSSLGRYTCVNLTNYDTIEGSERFNFNNHPFAGKAGHLAFALAHNGVLYNDGTLRRTHKLPHTKIETDSYVAVQLLEREGNLSVHSFQRMAEALLGTFTITVLDARENLYFVKGNNPLEILLLPELGCYLYASTAEILNLALRDLGMTDTTAVSVKIIPGDIMQIDRDGQRTVSRFDDSALWYDTGFSLWPYSAGGCPVRAAAKDINTDDAYWEDLKMVAAYFGYSSEMIDRLRHHGFQPEEVEEYLYEGGGVPCGYF